MAIITGDVSGLVSEIKDKARVLALTPYTGTFLELPPLLADWEGEWTEFLELGASLGAKLLYFHPTKLDARMLMAQLMDEAENEFLDEYDEEDEGQDERLDEGSSAESEWLAERISPKVKPWAAKVGELSTVQVLWIFQGMAHCIDIEADWYGELMDVLQELAYEAKNVALENRRALLQDEAKLRRERAEFLAKHERWDEATSEAKRTHMAEAIFPELIFTPSEAKKVAALAYLFNWWNMEPAMRKDRKQKISDLHAEGYNAERIAELLNIPLPGVLKVVG